MKKHSLLLGICIAILMGGCADDGEIVTDFCKDDPNKLVPGICGCGEDDALDENENGVPDCLEKAFDQCPEDPAKTVPGICGCGVPDVDTDNDGTPDCFDLCPEDATRTKATLCACGADESIDEDEDGIPDCVIKVQCPEGSEKETAGVCGCNTTDTDTDGDTMPDCVDKCPEDPDKVAEGICGCGAEDADTDGDGVYDCKDECPLDPEKTQKGLCGCGKAETLENLYDSDNDGVINCLDACPQNPIKSAEGSTGSGCEFGDIDGDGFDDAEDACPYNPNIHEEGKDCNYVTDDAGNTVFEIWSPYDLKRLSEESAKTISLNPLINTPCETEYNQKYRCVGKDNPRGRLICSSSNSMNIWTISDCETPYTCTPDSLTNTASCKCNQTQTPKAEGDCCNANSFVQRCGDDDSLLACINGIVQKTECNGNCIVPEATEETPNPVATCTSCKGEKISTGGKVHDCCDRETYTNTCISENKILNCSDAGVVQESMCAAVCVTNPETKIASCPSCIGEKVETDGEEYTCCDEAEYKLTCTSENKLKTCSDGRVRIEECDLGCEIDAEKNTGSCKQCNGEMQETGGKENDCCDTNTYVNSCAEDGTMLTCEHGRVTKQACIGSCRTHEDANEKQEALCIKAPEKPEKEIQAIVMKNLNMADVVPMEETQTGCAGNWESLNIYHTHIDGNHKKITYRNEKQRCALTRPIFNHVMDSTLKNISLEYDMNGAASSALSNYMYQTAVEHVSYKGTWFGGHSIFGESKQGSGVLTVKALKSSFDNVGYSGEIKAITGGFHGLMQNASASYITNADISPSSVLCDGMACSMILQSLNPSEMESLVKDIHISIPKLETSTSVAGGINSNSSSTNYVENIDAKFSNITASNSPFYGFGSTVYALKHANIEIKDSTPYTFFGIGSSLYNRGEVSDIKVTLENIKSNSPLYGLSSILSSSNAFTASGLHLSMKSIQASTIYVLANSISASLNNINIELSNLKATNSLYLLSNSIHTPNPLSNLIYHADSIITAGTVYGVSSISTNFNMENSDFQIDYLQGNGFQFISKDAVKANGISFKDLSIYADIHTNGTTTPGFFNLFNSETCAIELNRVVVSSRINKFTTTDSDGKANNSKENETSPIMYTDSAANYASFNTENVYWLKRNTTQKASACAAIENKFIPFAAEMTDDLVSVLNEAAGEEKWEARETKEGENTIKIPALKK